MTQSRNLWAWIGFELKRKMTVTEIVALGKGISTVEFHKNPNVSQVLFGINSREEWEQAVNLGIDAVYTDNPEEILNLKRSRSCTRWHCSSKEAH